MTFPNLAALRDLFRRAFLALALAATVVSSVPAEAQRRPQAERRVENKRPREQHVREKRNERREQAREHFKNERREARRNERRPERREERRPERSAGRIGRTERRAEYAVPRHAEQMARSLRERRGEKLQGYEGGSTFRNVDRKLPREGSYREYDVHPKRAGVNRGEERIVRDTRSGKMWYTRDHYRTFKRIP